MYKSLDGLRALAVLSVMAFHYGIFSAGWIGVQFFFVLSGFLISHNLLSYKTKEISTLQKFLYFFRNRTLRIFPAYYLYLVIVLILNALVFKYTDIHEKTPYLLSYTFNLIRANNNWFGNPLVEHLWSLSIEEQFYLFWPFVILLLSVRNIKIVSIILLLLIPVFRILYYLHLTKNNIVMPHTGIAIYYHTLSQIDAFVTGCCIALFKILEAKFDTLRVMLTCMVLFFLLGFINYFSAHRQLDLYYFSSLGYKIGEVYNFQYAWSYTLINIFSASVICFSILYSSSHILFNIYNNIINSKFLTEVGKVSYGMYLYHWLIMKFIPDTLHSGITKIIIFPIYALVVFFVSWLSFRLFESRFTQYKYVFK